MGTCFVIQPFDGGAYDKRYEGVLTPAIKASGLEPYRVDKDPSVSIPIDEIGLGIRNASVCLADITEDNPNVWFELGYAIAARIDVVLVCSNKREIKFPFDVQHRAIIKYSTESPRDFEELKEKITARIKALLAKQDKLVQIETASPVADFEGLNQLEIVALVSIAQNVDRPAGNISAFRVRQDMEKVGFTGVAITIGLQSLIRKKLASCIEEQDSTGDNYAAYSMNDSGMDWLIKNQDRLVLRRETERKSSEQVGDDLPF